MSAPRLAGLLAAGISLAVVLIAFLVLVDPRWA